jgi:hypothetical protein
MKRLFDAGLMNAEPNSPRAGDPARGYCGDFEFVLYRGRLTPADFECRSAEPSENDGVRLSDHPIIEVGFSVGS